MPKARQKLTLASSLISSEAAIPRAMYANPLFPTFSAQASDGATPSARMRLYHAKRMGIPAVNAAPHDPMLCNQYSTSRSQPQPWSETMSLDMLTRGSRHMRHPELVQTGCAWQNCTRSNSLTGGSRVRVKPKSSIHWSSPSSRERSPRSTMSTQSSPLFASRAFSPTDSQ
uniref:Uncharacterized protein n=1 Tax=Riboviria sp. TaxID=2585031 RepID=A0A8K1U4T1_9VIRU|nr:MAG: hypothetical protein 2 [Riboviria sp.]